MKQVSLCLLLTMLMQVNAGAQKATHLQIGDVVPDLELKNVINYKTPSVRLSDFNGKLLILDFWATWCGPCIGAFPKLDSLQRKFGSKVMVLPVTAESKSIVADFMKKIKVVKDLAPISVVDDEILNRAFSHLELPHYVWLDGNRKVIAVTDSRAITEKNIELALQDQLGSLPVKIDDMPYVIEQETGDYSLFAPVMQVNKAGTSLLENLPVNDVPFFSSLTRYSDGLKSTGCHYVDSTQLNAVNWPPKHLFNIAFMGNTMRVLNATATVVDIPDSALYLQVCGKKFSSGAERINWMKENGYCYVIKVAPQLASQKESMMLADLNDYFGKKFGIEGRIEKRNTKYLALIRSGTQALSTKGGKPGTTSDKFSLKLSNVQMSALLSELVLPLQRLPLLYDETGFTERFDMEITCQLNDLKALNKELDKYGLQIVEKQKEMNVCVVGMINPSSKKQNGSW